MGKDFTVRVLTEAEYEEWDQLVETSPTGTAYNTSWWVGTLARLTGAQMEIVGCFKDGILSGGCAAYIRRWGTIRRVQFPPTTPYNGFVLRVPQTPNYRRQVLHYLSVTEAIAECMEDRYDEIRLRHHFGVSDVRSLTWRGWTSSANYTYVVSTGPFDALLSQCSSSTKRGITRARKAGLTSEECDDLSLFMPLYEKTYQKQGLQIPFHYEGLNALFQAGRDRNAARLYVTRDPDGHVLSGLVQLVCGAHANTWVLASDPERLRDGVATCTQLYSFSRYSEQVQYVDDASANIENLHQNAIRLGGELQPVFGTYLCNSAALQVRHGLRGAAQGVKQLVSRRRSQ